MAIFLRYRGSYGKSSMDSPSIYLESGQKSPPGMMHNVMKNTVCCHLKEALDYRKSHDVMGLEDFPTVFFLRPRRHEVHSAISTQ